MKSPSHVQLFVTPWTVACQAPPSMGFSRQEYWSGLPFPSPGGLPDPGIKLGSPALQADSLPSESPGNPCPSTNEWVKKMCYNIYNRIFSSVTQSCPILCDPMDCSSPGSSVFGILRERILEWVAISFSRGPS